MRETVRAALDNITDTFTGADGGISFIQFRMLVERMDEKAAAYDVAAREVIGLVVRFSKLIDVAKELSR